MTYNFPRLEGVYDHLIVHCTATPVTVNADATWLDRVHRQKGWSGCGYHIVILRSGEVQWSGTGHRTRPYGKIGSHVGGCGAGWNARSIGVTLVGGVKEDARTPEENFTTEQYTALRAVIGELVDALGIPEDNVMGHRDLIKLTKAAPKACPCFSVREFLADAHDLEAHEQATGRLSFKWNRKTQPAPDRGEKLVLPRIYTVVEGDTLWGLSRSTGVPLADIRKANEITGNHLSVGQKLKLW